MVYILFGVSGSGKSLIGHLLSEKLGLPFYDADDFHSEVNIQKMSSGEPLTDEDRIPWLETLASHIQKWNANAGAVLACSALKKSYRELLKKHSSSVQFIFLKGSKTLISKRINQRKDHYMPKDLLDSQFETLEEPSTGEIISISVDKNPIKIVEDLLKKIETSHIN